MGAEKKNSIGKEIQQLIKNYAKVYSQFEKFQGDNKTSILPIGDQKTGVIGEYYAKKYIENRFNDKTITYEKHGEEYDLAYKNEKGKKIKVQVKVVSAHSKTRTISTLKLKGKDGRALFDFLYLISLDSDFKPCGFWINSYKDIFKRAGRKVKIDGTVMEGFNGLKHLNGSKHYTFSNDLVNELIIAIDC